MILSLELMVLGIVTLIFIIFVFFIGILTMAKYFEIKNKIFIYTGICTFGGAIPWSGVALFFICVVFFDFTPSMEIYFLFHGAFIPIASFLWAYVNLELYDINPTTRKWLKIIFAIFWMCVEILYILVIFTDTTLLGTLITEIQVDYAPLSELYLLIAFVNVFLLYVFLARHFWKSDDPRSHLQGKLLFISIFFYIFGCMIEIFIPIIPIIILARILIMIYAFIFYGGFIMPKWLENLLIGKRKS